MGQITSFQSLQNENPSKIDEIRPISPKNDHFCQPEIHTYAKRRQITQASCESYNRYKN